MDYNRCAFAGRLTGDVELKAAGQTQVAKFRIAINRRYTANGEKKEETEFVSLESWGKQAEMVAKYFKKGDSIFVEGRLKTDVYEKNGEKKYATKVVVENVVFVGGKKTEEVTVDQAEPSLTKALKAAATAAAETAIDVPF